MEKVLDKLLGQGVLSTVQVDHTCFVSPAFLVPKSTPGEYRLVTDHSMLNKSQEVVTDGCSLMSDVIDLPSHGTVLFRCGLQGRFPHGGLSSRVPPVPLYTRGRRTLCVQQVCTRRCKLSTLLDSASVGHTTKVPRGLLAMDAGLCRRYFGFWAKFTSLSNSVSNSDGNPKC